MYRSHETGRCDIKGATSTCEVSLHILHRLLAHGSTKCETKLSLTFSRFFAFSRICSALLLRAALEFGSSSLPRLLSNFDRRCISIATTSSLYESATLPSS